MTAHEREWREKMQAAYEREWQERLQAVREAASEIRGRDGTCLICHAPPQFFHNKDCPAQKIFAALEVQLPPEERYDSRPDTQAHIERVREFMMAVANNLAERAERHDASKLISPELESFDIATPKLAELVYGSEEYKQSLLDLGPALQHHFEENDHHPEHGSLALEWRSVVGYEGAYEVSSYGDVRSLPRTHTRAEKGDTFVTPGRELRLNVTAKGYLRVQLSAEAVPRNMLVHRLVAEAFIPNPDGKPEVNHLNGDKGDNAVTNLTWATGSENLIHAYDSGLREPSVKYVVHCLELDVTTFGCEAMAKALREKGHKRAAAAGVWAAMDRGGKHLDLTFEGTLLADYRRSMIRGMSLMALIEMLCDWRAASERVKQRTDDPEKMKSFESGLAYNQERFGYSDELAEILQNTVRELGL